MPVINYKDHLFKELQDLDYAAGYLSAAFEEGEDVFLLAIKDVVDAHGGMTAISRKTKLNRENLYQILSNKGNPKLSSLKKILDKLGLSVKLTVKLQGTKAA